MANTIVRRLTARDTRLSSFRYYDLLVHVFVFILLIDTTVLITIGTQISILSHAVAESNR